MPLFTHCPFGWRCCLPSSLLATLLFHPRCLVGSLFQVRGRLISASLDGTVRVWSAKDGSVRWISEYEDRVDACTIDRVRGLVVFSTGSEKVEAWDIWTGQEKWLGQLDADTNVSAIANSEFFGLLVTGLDDGKLLAWRTDNGVLLWTGVAHEGAITELHIDRHQGVVISAEASGRVTLWGIEDGACIVQVPPVTAENITTFVHYDADRQVALTCHGDGSIRAFRPSTLSISWEVVDGHFDYVRCAAVDPLRGIIITGGGDGLVHCWLLASGLKLWTADFHSDDVTGIAIDSARSLAITCSLDTTVRCCRLENGRQVWAAIHPSAGFPIPSEAENGAVLAAQGPEAAAPSAMEGPEGGGAGKPSGAAAGANGGRGGPLSPNAALVKRAGEGAHAKRRVDIKNRVRKLNTAPEDRAYQYDSYQDAIFKVRPPIRCLPQPLLFTH